MGQPGKKGAPARRESRAERALLAVAAGAVLTGLLLRLGAARGDLWLDELWSLYIASVARSPFDVLWSIHHDNNNYLNTLWMLVVGGGAPPILYRMLAVASGLGAVAVAAAAPLRPGRLESAVAAVLMALSCFMVHYGSEARGYGPAMFFALASFVSLDRFLRTRQRRWAVAFAVTASLGVLSHLTFLLVLAGAFSWAAFELARRRDAKLADCALLGAPLLLVAFLWLVDIRFLEVGGAPSTLLAGSLRLLLSKTFGLPPGPLELLAVGFVGAAAYELLCMAREGDSRAIFFGALFAAPVISLVAWRPDYAFPRHFAVLVPFTLVLAAGGLTRLARLGRWGVAIAGLALAVFALGNGIQIALLLRDGRGRYRDAVELMLARSTDRAVTIGAGNDFRVRMVLDDQARRLGVSDRIVFIERANLASHNPEWMIYQDPVERPGTAQFPQLLELANTRYALTGIFPYGGLSGFSWILYRRLPEPSR
ncbi:MAG TPA: hypothetical protein VKF60_18115 [Myxococcota bacterium]|nr:hypothetical protein [Myxococcota bacterium]